MSGIRQYQRRALEALKPEKDWPLRVSICNTDEYCLDNRRIYLLGISKGIGTCSDLHGIYIAVFGFSKPDRARMPVGHQEVICSWSALLREPIEKEFQNELKDKKRDIPYLVVELIEPIMLIEKDDNKHIYHFKSTTKKKFYVNTI